MTRKGILVFACTVVMMVCFCYVMRKDRNYDPVQFCSCDNSKINTTLSPLDFVVQNNRTTPDHLPDLRQLKWPNLPYPKSKPSKGIGTHFQPRVTMNEYQAFHLFVSSFATAMQNIGCGDKWFVQGMFVISLDRNLN